MRKPALAINYSEAAAELASLGRLPVDCFKCPPWPKLIDEARRILPVYVHWDFLAGRGNLDDTAFASVDRWLGRDQTAAVNTHLAPAIDPEIAVTESHVRDARARIEADLSALCDRYSPGRVLLENVPWERRADFDIPSFAAGPEEMTRWVDHFGVGLLLDLAHARFAAEELGRDASEWVGAHPVGRLRELHTTGLGYDAGGRRRDHSPWETEDVELLLEALDRIARAEWPTPRVIALEYGGVGPTYEWRSDRAVIEEESRRLDEWLRDRGLRAS